MNDQTAASTQEQDLQEPDLAGTRATDTAPRPDDLQREESLAGGARYSSDEVPQHLEAALADELALHQRVHEVSCRLIPAEDVRQVYSDLLDAAIDLAAADRGTMQAVDPTTGELHLLEARGIPEELRLKSQKVAPDALTSCALALRGARREYVDYQTDERVAGSSEAALHLEAGIRAAQSTPLVSRSGEVVGMLSTHWIGPHVLPEHRARLLDIIARQAADLIERIRSEEALRESEQRLRIATSAAGVGLHRFDIKAGTVEWDERTRQIWGVDPDEPVTYELWRDSLHPDDIAAAEAAVRLAIDPDGDGRYAAEYRVTSRRDGKERWVLALGQTTFVDGVPVRLMGTAQEITERKADEEELRESRQQLRLALEAGQLGDWYLDLTTGEAITSFRHDQCFGATEPFDDWSLETFIGFVHPDDRADIQRRFERAVATQGALHVECRVIWADESIRWIEARGTVHRDAQGEPRSLLGVVQDITERKNAEEQLRRTHETFFHLVANSPFGVYIIDSDFRLVQISQGARKVFEQVRPLIGRDLAEVLRHLWEEPFASEAIARFRHTLLTGEPYVAVDTTERRHDIADVESYDWRIERITLPDGQFGVVCYFYDLSDIKRAEEELQNRSVQLETLIDQAPLGVYLLDADLRIAHVNPVAVPVFGDVPDLVGRRFEDLIFAFWGVSRGQEIMGIFRRTLETGESFHVPEFSEYREDRGITEYYDWRTERIVLPDGCYGVVCYFHDISDQVRAREAIAGSEAKYRTLFESIDEGFAVIDVIFDVAGRPVDYRFIELNPAFERHTGLRDAEGKTAREFVPDLEDHWFETYGRVARTGQPERFVNHARTMDDRWFDVYAFRLGGESSSRVALLFKDITSQRHTLHELAELNRTLEQRVAERTGQVQELATRLTLAEQEERRRIARMLHDGLQQLLYGIHLRLESLIRGMAEPAQQPLRADFEVARDWVSEAIEAARQLSLELNPPVLHGEGLAKALDWLADQMSTKHGLSVELDLDTEVRIQNEDLRSLLFHTTRELLFNIVKHAGVNQASLRLAQQDGQITVEVVDDGSGFDARALDDPGASGGLGLFSVRERLRLIGGTVDIRSELGSGTRVSFSAPEDGYPDPNAPGRDGSPRLGRDGSPSRPSDD